MRNFGNKVVISPACWIGDNVVMLPKTRLGAGCVVGAGSVVTKFPTIFSYSGKSSEGHQNAIQSRNHRFTS